MPGLDKSPSNNSDRSILSGPVDLLQSTAHTFIQTPIDGVTQIFNKATNQHLHPVELVSAPTEQNGWTFAGDTIGSVAQFVLATKGLRLGLNKFNVLEAAAPTRIWESAASGAAVELLHPVSDNESNFLWAKVRNAGITAGTFAAMSGTARLASQADFVGQAGRRNLAQSIGLQAFAGTVGGMTNAELDALGHGKPFADPTTFVSRTAQYAAFGALFGVADATLYKVRTGISPAKDGVSSGMPTSDEYVTHLNGRSLKSPMLTWLAENRPNLRPPNYEAYKAGISSTPTTELQHMDLNAWPPEQRPAVLAEIRKIASKTQLSSDSNIDAFISRLQEMPELKAYSSPNRVAMRTEAYSRWSEASGRLENFIEADPQLSEMPLGNLLAHHQLHEGNPGLKRLIDEVGGAEGAYQDLVRAHVAETNVEGALTKTLNKIAREVGLPKLNGVEVTSDHSQGSYQALDVKLGIGENVLKDGLTAETAETGLHEFVHHDYRVGLTGNLIPERPNTRNPVRIQLRIDRELTKLSEPGGTLDLLQRLSDPNTMTYRSVTANGALPKDIKYFAEKAKAGEIITSRWDETGINAQLKALLLDRQAASRIDAWKIHTSRWHTNRTSSLVNGILN